MLRYVAEEGSKKQFELSLTEDKIKICDTHRDGYVELEGIKNSHSSHVDNGQEQRTGKILAPPPPSIRPRSPISPPIKRLVYPVLKKYWLSRGIWRT